MKYNKQHNFYFEIFNPLFQILSSLCLNVVVVKVLLEKGNMSPTSATKCFGISIKTLFRLCKRPNSKIQNEQDIGNNTNNYKYKKQK